MSNSEILREFLLETHENLGLLDSDLLRLEQAPADRDALAAVFRTFHSVKGTAGFMGLNKLQSLAHAAENLLTRLRAGELKFHAALATALLQVVDALREILAAIEQTGGEGARDYSPLLADLERLRQGAPETARPAPAEPVAPAAPPSPPPAGATETARQAIARPPVESLGAAASVAESVGPAMSTVTTPAPAGVRPGGTIEPRESPSVEHGDSAPADSGPVEATEAKASSAADTAVRVDVDLLDKLMTLVGELVLARNQLLRRTGGSEDDGLHAAVQKLDRLTTELQNGVMKTRMQPIGGLFNKFPRLVRDMALACGKQVRVEMEGRETELDRSLLEAIRDPLTHMIRNAVDHGVEAPEVRRARGKPEEGRLRLSASHEGGKVIVELADDGQGIDLRRVRDKVLDARLATPDAVARMSSAELLRYLFLPGVSTAERVTEYSGRGVGLDVVRTNIERIGGSIDVESAPGAGTTIRLKVPLTLAILPALIVECGGERYAIPQLSLLELVRVDAERAEGGVERIQGVRVHRLRGGLLPLTSLAEQLQIDRPADAADESYVVVLQAGESSFGLLVDRICDTEEIVVKPLQKQFKSLSVYAGATIMGDGRVALVLDATGLAQRSGLLAVARGSSGSKTAPEPPSVEARSLLVFEVRGGRRLALPLADVSRLETIAADRMERLAGRPVVQYRGGVLPLVDVAEALDRRSSRGRLDGSEGSTSSGELAVVVGSFENRAIGLIVERIVDVVAESSAASEAAEGRSPTGDSRAAVLDGRVTELVDLAALVRSFGDERSYSEV